MSLLLARSKALVRCGRQPSAFLTNKPPYPRSRFHTSRTCSEDATATAIAETEPIGKETAQQIERHGVGDATITLNVGGKEFHTLRSTVCSNPVLAKHVYRAEANHEITKNGAVFIDRDPEHFGFILKYLRNRMDAIEYSSLHSYNSPAMLKSFTNSSSVLLPKDENVLRDLYMEAAFYDITELKHKICKKNWLANLMGIFGAGNPFDTANRFVAQARNATLTVTAFSTAGGTAWLTAQDDLSWLWDKMRSL